MAGKCMVAVTVRSGASATGEICRASSRMRMRCERKASTRLMDSVVNLDIEERCRRHRDGYVLRLGQHAGKCRDTHSADRRKTDSSHGNDRTTAQWFEYNPTRKDAHVSHLLVHAAFKCNKRADREGRFQAPSWRSACALMQGLRRRSHGSMSGEYKHFESCLRINPDACSRRTVPGPHASANR